MCGEFLAGCDKAGFEKTQEKVKLKYMKIPSCILAESRVDQFRAQIWHISQTSMLYEGVKQMSVQTSLRGERSTPDYDTSLVVRAIRKSRPAYRGIRKMRSFTVCYFTAVESCAAGNV